MNNEKKNMLLLVVLSTAILFGFHYFYEKPRMEALQAEQKAQEKVEEAAAKSEHAKRSPLLPVIKKPAVTAKTIRLDNDKISGSFRSQGFSFSDLTLKTFKEEPDADSAPVKLLQGNGDNTAYSAEFGWTPADAALKFPTEDTIWETDSTELTPESPVVMTWDNGEGLIFKKIIEVDEHYMLTIRQTIHNKTTKPVSFRTHASIKQSNPTPSNYVVLHEGALGYLNGKLQEVKYEDLKKDKKETYVSQGGWFGITDKYWLTALVPDQNIEVDVAFTATQNRGETTYATGFKEPNTTVASGKTFTATTHFFAGAKSLDLLDRYEELYNIPHFDLAIDFGWFYFITKPLFFAVKWLFDLLGNFGLAIIALTILVRLSFYPLANKSFHSMAKMKELQPEVERIKRVYDNDKQRLQQEMMGLYKKHGVNPVAGCLPMLIQIPVFFALYKVLFVTIEMRHAPFYGWLVDLSAPDPITIFNLFGLISWTPPSFLMIGVLPIIMSISMYVQQKLNPQPSDPIQEKVFKFLPLVFLFMLANFPAGLILYWICSNIFSIVQQWFQIKRRQRAR